MENSRECGAECDRPIYARGLCESHYARRRKDGDMFNRGPIGICRRAAPEVRFLAKVEKQPGSGCWLWTGPKNQSGYGQFHINKVAVVVHRFSYEMVNGKIPPGYDIDHTCWVRSCVNPAHLRLATRKQNVENQAGLKGNNTSGVEGVTWDAEAGKWRARVGHNGKRYSVGRFDSLLEAEIAVRDKRNELFTHNDKDRKTPSITEGDRR